MLAALLALLPSPAPASDLVLDAASNFVIEGTVNGRPVRLRVNPAAPGYVSLNPDAVARVGLRPSLTRVATRIGPVRLRGHSKEARVTLGGVTGKRRIIWLDRPSLAEADGAVGPADLPYDRVIFNLGPARPGEARFELPLEYERGSGLFFPMTLGDHVVRFAFTTRAQSMTTAAAGAHIAALHGGEWLGAPQEQVISFGIVRPVRAMRLREPVAPGGLRVSQFFVRTGDHRGNLVLPADAEADPDEVVVTGESRQRAEFAVSLGMDFLTRCSSMVWDNRTRRMTLSCLND